MKTLDSLLAELNERDEQMADVCQRLAFAHDLLIRLARRCHEGHDRSGKAWTECGEWPCRDIGLEITRKGR